MSAADLHDRPSLQSYDEGLANDSPPISRMAVLCLIVGIFSLLAALSTVILPLCVLAIALGIVSTWLVGRNDAVGGLTLAQVGLGLGVVSAVWSVTAASGRNNYMYVEAGKHAEIFLETLSAGKKFEALEYLRPEPERQITGTDLKAYYESGGEEEEEAMQGFFNNDATKEILAGHRDAHWEFARGIDFLVLDRNNSRVTVEMRSDAKNVAHNVFRVAFARKTGLLREDTEQHIAHWNVSFIALP